MKKFLAVLLTLAAVLSLTFSLSGCSSTNEEEEKTTEPIVPITQVESDAASQLEYVMRCINAIKTKSPYAVQRGNKSSKKGDKNDLKSLKLTDQEGNKVKDALSLLKIYLGSFEEELLKSPKIASVDFKDFTKNSTIGQDSQEDTKIYLEKMNGDFFLRKGDVPIMALTPDDIESIVLVDGSDLQKRSQDENLSAEEKAIEGFSYEMDDELYRRFRIVLKDELNPAQTEGSAASKVFDLNPNQEQEVCEELSRYNEYFSFSGYNAVYHVVIEGRIEKETDRAIGFNIEKHVTVMSDEDGVKFTDKMPTLSDRGVLNFSVEYIEKFTYTVTWDDPTEEAF